ncbi:hypothetical protein [Desemzia sp. FAM 23990]|uniref:hypothetical protein n=1 Tax=Desemzia sp. FAM 23990 TaxID=3259520 RepID=UPI0038886A35
MKITLQNEVTGLHLILKKEGMIEEQAVLAAYELVSGNKRLKEDCLVSDVGLQKNNSSGMKIDQSISQAFQETREACLDELKEFEGLYPGYSDAKSEQLPIAAPIKTGKKNVDQGKPRPRQVEFINAGNTLFTPLAEKFEEVLARKNDIVPVDKDSLDALSYAVPLWVKDKHEDEPYKKVNVPIFVDCPSCEFAGRQFTFRGNRYAKCKECGEKLFLRPAGREWGELDNEGNEYYASAVYKDKAAGGVKQ